jgi:hypothetical protein
MYFFGGFFLLSLGFGPNSGYWCRVFLDLTENFTKHPENRCPCGALIHLRVIRKDSIYTFQSFQKVDSHLG